MLWLDSVLRRWSKATDAFTDVMQLDGAHLRQKCGALLCVISIKSSGAQRKSYTNRLIICGLMDRYSFHFSFFFITIHVAMHNQHHSIGWTRPEITLSLLRQFMVQHHHHKWKEKWYTYVLFFPSTYSLRIWRH